VRPTGGVALINARFGVAFLRSTPVSPLWLSHCRSPKGALAFYGGCGIFWCSQRAALIDPHRLRGAFFGCTYVHAIYSLIGELINSRVVGIC